MVALRNRERLRSCIAGKVHAEPQRALYVVICPAGLLKAERLQSCPGLKSFTKAMGGDVSMAGGSVDLRMHTHINWALNFGEPTLWCSAYWVRK